MKPYHYIKKMKISNHIICISFLSCTLIFLGYSHAEAISPGTAADPVLQLADRQEEYQLGYNLLYFKDITKKVTIDDLLRGKHRSEFIQNTTKYVTLGHQSAAFWFQINIEDRTDVVKNWILELAYNFYETIEVYTVDSKGHYSVKKSGNYLPAHKRDVKYRFYAFKIRLEKQRVNTIYIRLAKKARLIVPLTLWSPTAFSEKNQNEYILMGCYYGLMLVMILYNFFLFISLRDKNYLYYVFYIASFMLWYLTYQGLAYTYLWPNSPLFHVISPFLLSPVLLFWILKFTSSFLLVKKLSPVLNTVMYVLMGMAVVEFVFFATGSVNTFISILGNGLNAGVIITVYIAAIVSYRRGFTSAKYIILGWFIFSLGMISFNLVTFNILQYNDYTKDLMQIGSACEVILFSFALADRINVIRREKIQAQWEAIQNLEKADEIKNEFLNSLEAKVDERTEELKAAMEEVDTINKSLVLINKELSEAHQVALRDMHMAVNVQENFLPKEVPQTDEWDIAYVYTAMTGVSGDFYDFYCIDDELKGVGLFDVSGHGIASGLVTMIAKSLVFRSFSYNSEKDLGEIFNNTNASLRKEIKGIENYVTGVLVRFRGNAIDYVNAGHPDVFIKSNGKAFQLHKENDESISGVYLGAFDGNLSYETITYEIHTGDFIILFSDCLNESRDENNKAYGFDRIKATLEMAPEGSAQDLLDFIVDDFYKFVPDKQGLQDDLTLIVAKRL